jgi:hypothetical protein
MTSAIDGKRAEGHALLSTNVTSETYKKQSFFETSKAERYGSKRLPKNVLGLYTLFNCFTTLADLFMHAISSRHSYQRFKGKN